MKHTSSDKPLPRIEMAQDMPVAKRMLAGVFEEVKEQAPEQKSANAPKTPKARSGKTVRFGAGFLLMFASPFLVRLMPEIHILPDTSEELAPFVTTIMESIAVTVVFAMIFFAFKIQSALFRIIREPARLPFALGAVAGLALTLGPVEITDTVMA